MNYNTEQMWSIAGASPQNSPADSELSLSWVPSSCAGSNTLQPMAGCEKPCLVRYSAAIEGFTLLRYFLKQQQTAPNPENG